MQWSSNIRASVIRQQPDRRTLEDAILPSSSSSSYDGTAETDVIAFTSATNAKVTIRTSMWIPTNSSSTAKGMTSLTTETTAWTPSETTTLTACPTKELTMIETKTSSAATTATTISSNVRTCSTAVPSDVPPEFLEALRRAGNRKMLIKRPHEPRMCWHRILDPGCVRGIESRTTGKVAKKRRRDPPQLRKMRKSDASSVSTLAESELTPHDKTPRPALRYPSAATRSLVAEIASEQELPQLSLTKADLKEAIYLLLRKRGLSLIHQQLRSPLLGHCLIAQREIEMTKVSACGDVGDFDYRPIRLTVCVQGVSDEAVVSEEEVISSDVANAEPESSVTLPGVELCRDSTSDAPEDPGKQLPQLGLVGSWLGSLQDCDGELQWHSTIEGLRHSVTEGPSDFVISSEGETEGAQVVAAVRGERRSSGRSGCRSGSDSGSGSGSGSDKGSGCNTDEALLDNGDWRGARMATALGRATGMSREELLERMELQTAAQSAAGRRKEMQERQRSVRCPLVSCPATVVGHMRGWDAGDQLEFAKRVLDRLRPEQGGRSRSLAELRELWSSLRLSQPPRLNALCQQGGNDVGNSIGRSSLHSAVSSDTN